MSAASLLIVVFGIWLAAGVTLSVRAQLRGTRSVGENAKRAGAIVGMVGLGPESWLLGKTVLAAQDAPSTSA